MYKRRFGTVSFLSSSLPVYPQKSSPPIPILSHPPTLYGLNPARPSVHPYLMLKATVTASELSSLPSLILSMYSSFSSSASFLAKAFASRVLQYDGVTGLEAGIGVCLQVLIGVNKRRSSNSDALSDLSDMVSGGARSLRDRQGSSVQ